jgi:hypothetical protein
MWTEFHDRLPNVNEFDRQGSEDQERWLKTARCAISCLPLLMSRIANRAIQYSQALRELERASRIEMNELETARLKKNWIVR